MRGFSSALLIVLTAAAGRLSCSNPPKNKEATHRAASSIISQQKN